MIFFQGLLCTLLAINCLGDISVPVSKGREEFEESPVEYDFSSCVTDPTTGQCCVDKEEINTSMKKKPIIECKHKTVEQCHYTYITQFQPSQEEFCEENFKKNCFITFKPQVRNQTRKECYRPVEKLCNGQGKEVCETVYESACTTKYVEKEPGKFVRDTKCTKLPVKICGAGCTFKEGKKDCHDKLLTSSVDLPEEVCDLNPQKSCKNVTKLVPRLLPRLECSNFPTEICTLKMFTPKQVSRPLKTRRCLEPTSPSPKRPNKKTVNVSDIVTLKVQPNLPMQENPNEISV